MPLTEAPTECGHKDFVLGCERCFFDMKGLCNGSLHVEDRKAQMDGAVLFNWHVLAVLKDLEDRLIPLTESLDLSKVSLAKNLIANLQQLSVYLIRLVASPGKLEAVMVQCAQMALAVQQQMKAEEQGKTEVKSSIVITG